MTLVEPAARARHTSAAVGEHSAAGSDEVTEPAVAVAVRTPQTCRSARRQTSLGHCGTALRLYCYGTGLNC